jgi:hypothetical protein
VEYDVEEVRVCGLAQYFRKCGTRPLSRNSFAQNSQVSGEAEV